MYAFHGVAATVDMIASWVNLTSAEVNGVPSCHFTFSRSLNVTVRPSFEISHDLASRSTGSNFELTPTSPSKMSALAITKRGSMIGLRYFGSFDGMRTTPPRV